MSSSARLSAGALFLGLLLALPYQASASSPSIPALVDKYAARYGIPLYIARNLVRVESGGRQSAVSPSGARGVMQLTPATARALGVNIHDTEQNIEGGMRYLRQQYLRFGRWDLALAAYHSGPQAVAKHNGVPPKSQAYVRRILGTTATVASRGNVVRTTASHERNAGLPQLESGLSWPAEGPITRGYGSNGGRYHAGIDISAPQGTPIRAAKAGTVALADWYYGYGRTVIVDHSGGVSTLYGHASKILVRAGEAVQEGQDIALVGCTGRCTGPHVHFEVRVNDRAVDPMSQPALAEARAQPYSSSEVSSPTTEHKKTAQHKPATRRSVTVTGNTTTTVTDTVRNGQVVRRVEETVFAQGQLRIRIWREFTLVDGAMKMVNERTRAYVIDGDDEEHDDEDEDEDHEDEDDDD